MKHYTKRCLVLLLAAAVVFSGGSGAFGTGAAIDSKKQEQRGVDEQLGGVRQERQENLGESERLQEEKAALEGVKAESEMTYNELVERLRYYETELDNVNRACVEAEENCLAQRERMLSRVRGMYMNTDGSTLESLLASSDITSFMEKVELFSVISDHDGEVLEDYKAALADMEYKRAIQASLAQETEGKVNVQQRAIEELSLTREELISRLSGLQTKIERLDSLEGELEDQSKKLESEIRELTKKAEAEAAAAAAAAKAAAEKAAAEKAAAERASAQRAAAETAAAQSDSTAAKAESTAAEAKSPAATEAAAAPKSRDGEMHWPLPGYTTLSSTFGTRVHPVT
ncbi:MAG: hypothetical protein LBU58_05945, partial [Clostridiales bacterium]|nr:hypothetical protein [Clostridiales bacterium]